MQSNKCVYILFRDFNAMHNPVELLGCMFSHRQADDFNWFINSSDLCDIHMGGFYYTRVSNNISKYSKLDRFLVSLDVLEMFPDLFSLALELNISDHRPIFLAQKKIDYGPRPFKFFNSWMLEDDFDQVV